MPESPTNRRLSLHAIEVLREAFRAAEHEPRPQTAATRLALGVLLRTGIAELHQAERFVEAMTKAEKPWHHAQDGYMRFTEMEQLVFTWEAEVRRRDFDGLGDGEEIG